MNIYYHREFTKHFKQRIARDSSIQQRFKNRLLLFESNPKNPLLRDHALVGERIGFRAFSITADIRVIYQVLGEDKVKFYDIGSHNQVY